MKHKVLFGPVLSRRLGISLGIDLVVPKTCSLDCIYCECGKTTNLTLARKELSWEPKVNLGEGLKKTIEYFKKRIDSAK